jgi:hypothetical protein
MIVRVPLEDVLVNGEQAFVGLCRSCVEQLLIGFFRAEAQAQDGEIDDEDAPPFLPKTKACSGFAASTTRAARRCKRWSSQMLYSETNTKQGARHESHHPRSNPRQGRRAVRELLPQPQPAAAGALS